MTAIVCLYVFPNMLRQYEVLIISGLRIVRKSKLNTQQEWKMNEEKDYRIRQVANVRH